VAPDGARFLVFRDASPSAARPQVLFVQGWLHDVRARASGPRP
jgi:hypothetical protein